VTDFYIADQLTGRRYNRLPVLDGAWTDTLNGTGEVWAKVSLRNPLIQRLDLENSAQPMATMLAAVDGDTVAQAGQIWAHEIDTDRGYLTLRADGGWGYWNRRALLPVLAGRLPSDPTTDTRYMPIEADPDKYLWPTDTRTSRQGMIVKILEQMMTHPDGDPPYILPSAIAGTAQDAFRGIDVASVGERIRGITQLVNGVDVHVQPRWNSADDGFEFVVRIGTTDQPLLYSAQRPVFNIGVAQSSITRLQIKVDGSRVASTAYSLGGKATDEALAAVSEDPTLTDAGFPKLEIVDKQRATVSELGTLQEYADELTLRGRKPVQLWTFRHNLLTRPGLSEFNVGDFAKVRVRDTPYIRSGEYILRLLSRSGDARGKTVDLIFQPTGEFTPEEA